VSPVVVSSAPVVVVDVPAVVADPGPSSELEPPPLSSADAIVEAMPVALVSV
jgi:hypothetical protein